MIEVGDSNEEEREENKEEVEPERESGESEKNAEENRDEEDNDSHKVIKRKIFSLANVRIQKTAN